MSQTPIHPARRAIVRFFYSLCLTGMAFGLAVCLFKSTGSKVRVLNMAGQTYLDQAREAGRGDASAAYLNNLARQSLFEALALDAASAESWQRMARVLEQQHAFAAADKARVLAARFGKPEDGSAVQELAWEIE